MKVYGAASLFYVFQHITKRDCANFDTASSFHQIWISVCPVKPIHFEIMLNSADSTGKCKIRQ